MEHIKITDLSIGDWVMYNLNRYRVVQIDEENEHVVISGIGGCRDKHIDYIEPISIKTDMLFQNGFNRNSNNEALWIYNAHLYKIEYNIIFRALNISAIDKYLSMTIHHVHELQRAFRTMGLTKEFEL